MIDAVHLTLDVIRPVLEDLRLHTEISEKIVLGTACRESLCGLWLHQRVGPAKGIYQTETPPMIDNLALLDRRPELKEAVRRWAACKTLELDEVMFEIKGNLYLATCFCRIHYLRFSEPIPDNLLGQAIYYKKYYNTILGKATVEGYIETWREYVPANVAAVLWSEPSLIV